MTLYYLYGKINGVLVTIAVQKKKQGQRNTSIREDVNGAELNIYYQYSGSGVNC